MGEAVREPGPEPSNRHPLQALIGGPRGAIESMLPPIVFVLAYAVSGNSLNWAVGAALGIGLILAALRIWRKERPIRVVGALLVVVVAALFAFYTGSAVAYFWPLVLANIASALAFALSILVRWPLLGVIVGPIVGTKMRWRQDPDLLRAYSRASWLWVGLNVIRAAVQIPLIQDDALWALAAIRPVFYLLVIGTILLSWVVIKRSLPADHPGIRHTRIPQPT
ncbi:MAG: DUF3159 domain-containing protein [Actinomycetales bacterium]